MPPIPADIDDALAPARRYNIVPVRGTDQQHIANMLVRRRFAWRGYNVDALGHHAEDSNRLTLAAWRHGKLVATLTLARDSAAGFQTDALYADELAQLRSPGRVLCEVSRLAVDPNSSCPKLLRALFAAALDYGIRLFAASDVVIGVNPRHAPYYQRRMGFRQIGGRRHYARVGAPIVLLHQTLRGLELAGAF